MDIHSYRNAFGDVLMLWKHHRCNPARHKMCWKQKCNSQVAKELKNRFGPLMPETKNLPMWTCIRGRMLRCHIAAISVIVNSRSTSLRRFSLNSRPDTWLQLIPASRYRTESCRNPTVPVIWPETCFFRDIWMWWNLKNRIRVAWPHADRIYWTVVSISWQCWSIRRPRFPCLQYACYLPHSGVRILPGKQATLQIRWIYFSLLFLKAAQWEQRWRCP